nr:acetyl-CoA carboxylase biotin carboxyl carrier protein [Candidatus Laterigemmans baculatus]
MSEGGKSKSDDVFDVERIRRLVRLMEEHDLSEIDLRQREERINLKRGPEAPPMVYPQAPAAPVVHQAPAAAAPAAAAPAQPSAPAEDGPNIVTIKAPMVGTFYSRPNPETDAFVKVGSMVQSDTVICIIEAMKVFNEIPAEVSGKVVAVLVDNEQSVEFGKPLFKIDTSA